MNAIVCAPSSMCGYGGIGAASPSARAALELEQRRDVVDDLAPGQQRTDVRADARRVTARGEAREVLRVAADRAHHQSEAASLRVEDPAQPVVLRAILDPGREPALD